MENLVFGTKPTQNGENYTGTLSGHLVEANSSFSNYPCPGPNLYYFDPNAVQWTWDGGAEDDFFYEYDYLNYFEQSTTYKAKFAAPDGATGEDLIICEYTQESREAIFRTPIYASNASTGAFEYTGMSREFGFSLTSEPTYDDSDNTYIFRASGGDTTKVFHVNASYIRIVEGQAPEPPALNALEWYFNEEMGYFSTNLYNDGYYSFSLNTNIVSVIYDRVNATLTANCFVEAAEGNMPEDYYEAQISFVYTNASGSVVDEVWEFNDAQCETTIEDKENLHFSVDLVSFTKLGWYYEEDLRYYIQEDVQASWNIDHCEYRKEGSRNEFVIYMDVFYNDEHIFPNFDVIQINNPGFGDVPYPGQINIGTGVSGWCDKLQQNISISCNYVPFAYYGNGWSYDAYHATLVYISSEDIELEYELTSVDVDGDYYNLTYTGDGDSQTIVVSDASYEDEVLTGNVILSNGGDSISVSLNIPQSMVSL